MSLDAKDLLLADLDRFEEALARNEEVGEKRFSFFLTLVTAVTAGLVSLAAGAGGPPADFPDLFGAGMGALLVVGLMTYLRMLHRNRVTEDYKDTLRYIRARYVALSPELASGGYTVPLSPRAAAAKWLRAGYAGTAAAIDGMLLVALLAVWAEWSAPAAGGAGAALTALLWGVAVKHRQGGPG